jgi:glycosyltransferase involved in cell wall biosynthesis
MLLLDSEVPMAGPKIVALIPAYNESDHITAVVQSVLQHLPVWVVDDGSKDDTAALAEAAGAQVIRQVPNQGKGAALVTGFRRCLEEGVQAAVMLDGDGQHDPQEIPLFLESYARQPVGLIIGQREFSKMPPLRRRTNTIGRWMFSWAVGQDVPDNQSGFRLVSRPLLELLVQNKETGFEFEVDMITICLKRKLGLAWVPISTIYRDEKSHIRPLHHLVHYFRIVVQARRIMRSDG